MAEAHSALPALEGAQALASGPQAHVWLSASAGTGKTHVLTSRVYRLLLNGAAPENILCLTFTKAGASEMAARIHERLAAWVQMDDADLALDLKSLGEDFSPPTLEKARKLFARVLEATGGGLRIQTIHAFCQQLLAGFPLEAGLVPGFRALEEREQAELRRGALAELVLEAEANGDTHLIAALQALALRMGEKEAQSYLAACTTAHDAFDAIEGDLRDWLFTQLDLPLGDMEEIIAHACSDERFDMASLRRLIEANAEWATKTGLEAAAKMQAWRDTSPDQRAVALDTLARLVLTKDGTLRKSSSGLVKIEPDYDAYAQRIADACSRLLSLRALAAYADLVVQGLHAGRAFAQAYARAKRAAGAVDYDDLIARTAELLHAPGIAEWICYKLDQQIDHILVDEAQDTNSLQWQIIRALAGEFFAGEGAKGDRARTIFTVGDFKQAIYGFQGTSPEAFARAREEFRQDAEAVEHLFHDLSLDRSFRSTPAVLDVVDATIAGLGAPAFGLEPGDVRHESNNLHTGQVSLWKPVAALAATDDNIEAPSGEEEWQTEQERVLAERIASQIAGWIDGKLMLESKGRPVTAGDIMILVRSRGDLARLILARLYEAGVQVAGIDRIRLQAPLAIMDLMAALRFAAQPDDDLNLASLLVSPIIGWTQQQLLDQAVPRKSSLWRHLRQKQDAPDLTILEDLLSQADFVTPYQFLERLLSGPAQGRARLLARLGEEARDAIDELLQAALGFEQGEHPSLQHFLDWFDREEGEIKRESDGRGDAVRLLTVHGAKGLQAPVVILADATYNPDKRRGMPRFEWPVADGRKLPFAPPRKEETLGPIARISEAVAQTELQEHWRLMYVALTRAEERLVLTGCLGKAAKGMVPENSWFAAADRGMQSLGAAWDDDPLWGSAIHWQGTRIYPAKKADKRAARSETAVELPSWLHTPAPLEARPPRPLAPTAQVEDDTTQPPPGAGMRAAAERGKCLHALFERLPAVVPAERRAAADRWLSRSAGIAETGVRDEIIDHALAIIDAPMFAPLFAPEALAEAPIAAIVGTDVIAGTVDRLLVQPDVVRIIDFKTGSRVPQRHEDIPVAHLRQMAAYVAALEVIFPGRTVEAALLYTSGPAIMTLDAEILSVHKPGLTGPTVNIASFPVEPGVASP